MIITRSPLRISLGGGGTDLPSYYRKHSGFLIAAAIDKYVYITLHQTFQPGLIIKYSKMEQVRDVGEVQHPIVREALRMAGITDPHLEITSMADIPAGTGLGSSGQLHHRPAQGPARLPQEHRASPGDWPSRPARSRSSSSRSRSASRTSTSPPTAGSPASSSCPTATSRPRPLKIDSETLYNLEDNLLLFFTGYSRSAGSILKEQDDKSKQSDKEMTDNLHFVKDLGYQSQEALEVGDLQKFGELMNVHWEHKKKRSGGMSNGDIDSWYALAMRQRRPRRQAHRRRRRRVPHVLRQRQDPPSPCPHGSRIARSPVQV